MNEVMFDQDEMEIDLGDLIKVLISRWKSIILCAVIVALIGGAVPVIKHQLGSAAVDMSQQEEALKRDYELLTAQYQDDMKLYENKEKTFAEYSAAVDMLTEELKKLDGIPKEDEDARMACLIKISSLQNVVDNADTMIEYYKKLEKPADPGSFEAYVDDNTKLSSGFSKKYALIGFVLGGFLACLGWAMLYLFDGTVKTASELTRYFGANALGSPDKQGLVAANVKNFMTEDIKKILVTGSAEDAAIKNIADAVAATVADVEIVAAGGLNYNADTAIMLSDVDAVILVEKLKKSKQNNITDELMMIRNAGKKLIGAAI